MRNKILLLITCLFTLNMSAQIFNVDTIAHNGNSNNRINLVIMGDGYMTSEMGTFRSDAQSVANYFFATPPFNLYQNFFNVYGIEVVSNESGNDHPGNASDEGSGTQPVTSVDNYLQTTFDYGGTHRCIYSSQGSLVYSIANDNVPLYDYINVIVNTSYYGGCAGGIAYTSMNSSSPEVFVHEFGHMFGNLSDEYDYGSSSCSAGSTQNINVTQVTDPNTIVWKNWLTSAPLPTPAGTNCSLIGAYEGAKTCSSNWYRPKCDCKMRSLNEPFCEVCFEQFIYKIGTMVNYIESYSPSNATPLTLCKNATMNFTADVLNSSNNTVRSQWLVDNVVVVNNSTNFTLNPSALSVGSHTVKLIALDTTVFSKKTMTPYQVSWTVNVLAAPAATAASNGTTFCSGQTLNLTSSGTGTFSWVGPGTYTSGLQNPSISGLDSTMSGVYMVTATNSCGTSSSSVNISVSSTINTSITPLGPITFCDGGSVVLDAGANASYSFQWYDNSGIIAGAGNHDFTVFQSGDYSVVVSINSTTCSATSAPVTVTVEPMPSANITTTDSLEFCEGSSALLETTTGAGYTYQWFRNNQLIVPATSSQWPALVSGTYTEVTSLGSCKDTAVGINIVVNPNPGNALTITGDTIFCIGDQVNLEIPACATCTYQWRNNGIGISGANTVSYNAMADGDYDVIVTDVNTACSSTSRSVNVDVHDMPLSTISANASAEFCAGDSIVLSVPSSSNYTYIWYLDTLAIVGLNASDIVVGTGGSYTVSISDVICSTLSDPFIVTVNPTPLVNISPIPDTVCVYNTSISLSGSPLGGIFSGDGVIDSTFNPSLAGTGLHTISYLYSDTNSCTDIADLAVYVDICLTVDHLSTQSDFIVYPNPVNGIATVKYSNNGPAEIRFNLVDLTGRVIESYLFSDNSGRERTFGFNTEAYSPGVYFIEMKSIGILKTQKLLITK